MTARVLAVVFSCALVVWGGYTTIAYLAVPAHQIALTGDATTAFGCGALEPICSGLLTLGPAISHGIGRWLWHPASGSLTPFAWCAVVSGVAAVVVRARRRSRGRHPIPFVIMSPLRVAAAFIAVLWLLFTALSLGDNGTAPYRQLFEPSPQAYPGAGAEALAALRANLDALQARGCLHSTGSDLRGVATFEMTAVCMQQAFVTRVLAPLAAVAVLALVALGVGGLIVRRLGWQPPTLAAEGTLAVTLGLCVCIVLLWSVARAGLFTAPMLGTLLAALGAAGAVEGARWLQRLRLAVWSFSWRWSDPRPLLFWLLLFFVAFNLLSVVRPFPIGWDDLGVYLNNPRLLVSYGTQIPQMATFQWEYLAALGFGLAGDDSPFGATLALTINWAASVLAGLSIHAFARVYLPRASLLAPLCVLTLPMVAQFSFADLKIDNAVFAVGVLAVLCALLAVAPPRTGDSPLVQAIGSAWPALGLAGALMGFAFSMKATAVMACAAVAAIVAGAIAGWVAFLGAAALAVAALCAVQIDAGEVSSRLGLPATGLSSMTSIVLLGSAGAIGMGAAVWRRRAAAAPLGRALALYAAGVLIVVAPWLISNNLAARLGGRGLLLAPPNTMSATLDLAGTMAPQPGLDIRSLPPDLRMNIAACTATGPDEERGRYWGQGQGWRHFATLPWRAVMNRDATGYHVTTNPALLLFPLVLLLPWFWSRGAAWMRWLSAATALLLLQWVLFGSGIPWYGIAMFLGLTLGVLVLALEGPSRWTRGAAYALVAISVLFNLSHREGQYQAMRHHFEYAIGKVSAQVVAERVIPHYDDVRDRILARAAERPDQPFAYRIGTFIAYFIPRNLGVLPIADNQLDVFACLNQERDARLTLRRLQALGFNSIVFDTTTASIEADPDGSLHRKVQAFLDFANTPGLGLEAAVSDTPGGIAFLLLP